MRLITSARGPLDRPARVARALVPAALGGIAAIHAAWAMGWRWPGGSDEAFAERVVGSGQELPPVWATWTVAGLLGAAAATVWLAGDDEPAPWSRPATAAIAAMMLVRGAVFVPVDLAHGLEGPFDRLDLAVYSPLCLALGAGAGAVARRHAPPQGPAVASQ